MGCIPAVNHQFGAGGELRLFRGEVKHGVSHIVGLAQMAKRMLRHKFRAGPSDVAVIRNGFEEPLHHLGFDETGMHGIDADVVASSARYSPLFENLLEVTLLRSGRPVLFVPAGCEILPLRRALIAWDSSSGCARAVSAWLDLAGESATASILHVEEQIGGDAPDMSEVLTHLGWHAVAAETETVARGSESIGGILLQAAESADADLVVMGGYGRARYREALLGGVTKHVIRQARVPVLMAH